MLLACLSCIAVYTPINVYKLNVKEAFYVKHISLADICIILGELFVVQLATRCL